MNKFEYKELCPFKWFVLQNFPFIECDFDAITNYQLYCKVVEYLNKVIEDMNLTGQQMENITNAFIELQNYVNNYFENLDVQEEIDNKLDEMSKNGTLLNILSDYTNLIRVYPTTIEMIENYEKLQINQIIKTNGYYEVNDGGGAFFIITNKIDDLNFQINLNNDLYATLIKNFEKLNILKCGCKGDNAFDNTTILQECTNKYISIYIPNGQYLITDRIVLPHHHKVYGEDMFETIINNKSNNFTFQYLQSYDYQSFDTLIDRIRITTSDGYKGKGIDFSNGSIKLTNCYLLGIYSPIHASGGYKDNIYIENVTTNYSPGATSNEYSINIEGNCDNLYINQLRCGFNDSTWKDDIQHSMRISYCSGGIIQNSTFNNHILIYRSSTLSLKNNHFESFDNQKFIIENSNVEIDGLFKWKNPRDYDIVIRSNSRDVNSILNLKNTEFVFQPATTSQLCPNVGFYDKDEWSEILCENVQYRYNGQVTDKAHRIVLFNPVEINPFTKTNDKSNFYEVNRLDNDNNLRTFYPTNISSLWAGADFTTFKFFITDDPNSNKYTNTSGNIPITNSCYFHLRNTTKATNSYCIIYGSNDGGTTYKRKWIVSLNSFGILFFNGESFNFSKYEEGSFNEEITNFIKCENIVKNGSNYILTQNNLIETTYNINDKICLNNGTQYIYTTQGLKQLSVQ